MIKSALVFVVLFLTITIFGQEVFLVTAENGIFLRNEPDAKGQKIGELLFGEEVTIIEQTKNLHTITDNGIQISGSWVKINFQNFPAFISNENSGYVFDGFLKRKNEVIKEIANEMSNYVEFKDLTLDTEIKPFFLRADIFGDGQDDLVVLLKNEEGETKIGLINYGQHTEIHLLGDKNDPFKMTNYNWVGIFEKVKVGEVLWSNYEDDFIEFKDVPESKKIRLNYNALYLHASESCGGGFVYWKDGKFNWLQQE